MSDIDPHQVQQAAENAPGVWQVLTSGLAAALGVVGGFVFKDQNQRLKSIESTHTEIVSNMATKDDIKNIYDKMNKNHEKTIDRIIEVVRDVKKGE